RRRHRCVVRIEGETLADVGRQRLRADDVLAGGRRLLGQGPVQVVRHAEIDELHVVAGEQLGHRRADLRDAELGGEGRRPVGGAGRDRGELGPAAERAVAARPGPRDESGADDADADPRVLLHRRDRSRARAVDPGWAAPRRARPRQAERPDDTEPSRSTALPAPQPRRYPASPPMSTTTRSLEREVARRRTFAIISHPDAGKTTLTEKLLLYGGAIRKAGSVKAKGSGQHATS